MVDVERARRPFWIHQLVEYLVGLALISASVQLPEPTVPAVMGLVVLFNAAIAQGAAGAFRLVPKPLHRRFDQGLIVLLLVAAVQPWVSVDASGRLLIVAIAIAMAFVSFYTDYAERPTRKERRAARARPGSQEIGEQAGRVVGQGVNTVKRWTESFTGSDDDPDPPAAPPADWGPPRPNG
jgi:hypothetical protein